MKKKRTIAISISIGVLITLILICAMVFTLREVSFQQTIAIKQIERSNLFADGMTTDTLHEQLSESAKFIKGGNLLFMKFDEQIDNMEKSKPFIKIEKVVRSFPNKVTVYYSEREPVCRVESSSLEDAYLVLDEDLKILAVVNKTDTKFNVPIIEDVSFSQSKPGEFINDAVFKAKLQAIVKGAFNANGEEDALYEDVLSSAKIIKFIENEVDEITGNDGTGVIIVFNNAETEHNITATIYSSKTRLSDKVAYLWKVYKTNLSQEHYTEDRNVYVYIRNGRIVVADSTAADSPTYDVKPD